MTMVETRTKNKPVTHKTDQRKKSAKGGQKKRKRDDEDCASDGSYANSGYDSESPPPQKSAKTPPKSTSERILEGKVEELEGENIKLKEALANQGTQELTKKSRKSKVKSERITDIHKWTKYELWRTVKFLTSPKQEEQVTKAYVEFRQIEEFLGKEPEKVAKLDDFVSQYGGDVTKLLNDQRSTAASAIRAACDDWMGEHNGQMPDLKTIEEIVCRKFDVHRLEQDAPNCEYDTQICQWYWDKCLPAAAGNGEHWKEDYRYYQTITEAHKEDDPNYKLIPPSTEAFALACLLSNHPKWELMYKDKLKYPKKQIRVWHKR